MIVSVASAALVRLTLSVVFGIWMNAGVIVIAWAMVCDWLVRAVFYHLCYRQGKWRSMKIS